MPTRFLGIFLRKKWKMRYHSFSVKNHIRQINMAKGKFQFVDMFPFEHSVDIVVKEVSVT